MSTSTMKMFLSIVCVFSLFFTTVKSLQCAKCAASGHDCSGTPSECPTDATRCVSIYAEFALHTLMRVSYVKTCGIESDCNIAGSMAFAENITERRNSSCCNSDFCTPPKPTLPELNRTLNGIHCPSCISLSSSSCLGPEKVSCIGDQTRCAKLESRRLVVGFPSEPVLYGCASEVLCSLNLPFSSSSQDYYEEVVCPNPDI